MPPCSPRYLVRLTPFSHISGCGRPASGVALGFQIASGRRFDRRHQIADGPPRDDGEGREAPPCPFGTAVGRDVALESISHIVVVTALPATAEATGTKRMGRASLPWPMTAGPLRRLLAGPEVVRDSIAVDEGGGRTRQGASQLFNAEEEEWRRRQERRRTAGRTVRRLLLQLTLLLVLFAAIWRTRPPRHLYCPTLAGSDVLGRWCERSAGRSTGLVDGTPSLWSSAGLEEKDEDEDTMPRWPPRQCSASELETIRWQIPGDVCRDHERTPWTNRCHLSYVTRCPDATWLTRHYASLAESLLNPNLPTKLEDSNRSSEKRTVVYVGCNKGMDAVNALRMASNDPTIDKATWRNAFFENATVQPGHCRQEYESQFPVVVAPLGNARSAPSSARTVVFEAHAHCVEAMPVTARHLANTAQRLGWHDRFRVHHAAVSHEPGWAWFPNPLEGTVGVEGLGMDACRPKRGSTSITSEQRKVCANVTVTTLDRLLANEPGPVDVLSIDVEGYDFNVLWGAQRTLPRVRYLEFEYNWKGPWGSHSLREAMDYVETFGFVCYWAGHKGRVWRITKCWRDAYNRHFWSNVACVNGRDASVRPVAIELERMFQDTLKQGAELGLRIDREFRAFYPDVKRGYEKASGGQLQFTELKPP